MSYISRDFTDEQIKDLNEKGKSLMTSAAKYSATGLAAHAMCVAGYAIGIQLALQPKAKSMTEEELDVFVQQIKIGIIQGMLSVANNTHRWKIE